MFFCDNYVLSKNWSDGTAFQDLLFAFYAYFTQCSITIDLLIGFILPVGLTLPVGAVLVSTVVTLSVGVMLSLGLYLCVGKAVWESLNYLLSPY